MNGFKTWNSYRHFAHSVRHQSRFIRTPHEDAFLREVLRTSQTRVTHLPAGLGLWRAQLGHGWRPLHQEGKYVDDIPAAYPPDRIKPEQGRATEGRANPKGIPVLYLSTRRETAMSEVRPWLGSLVSCAHFETGRRLRIIDLSVSSDESFVFYLQEPNSARREEIVWMQLGRAFSEPTTRNDDTETYAPTQLVAELFRSDGYDGIAYSSAFGKNGHNIALFSLDDAKLTACTLYQAKHLDFTFEQIDNPYWIEQDGTMKTMSIDLLGAAPITRPDDMDVSSTQSQSDPQE